MIDGMTLMSHRMQSIDQMPKSRYATSGSIKQSIPASKTTPQPIKRKLEDDLPRPLTQTSSNGQAKAERGREAKRSRLSAGPKIMASLANLINDSPSKPTEAETKHLKKISDQRRSSLIRGKGMCYDDSASGLIGF